MPNLGKWKSHTTQVWEWVLLWGGVSPKNQKRGGRGSALFLPQNRLGQKSQGKELGKQQMQEWAT